MAEVLYFNIVVSGSILGFDKDNTLDIYGEGNADTIRQAIISDYTSNGLPQDDADRLIKVVPVSK